MEKKQIQDKGREHKFIPKQLGIFLIMLFGISFAVAGTPIDTSDALLLAYYKDPAGTLDLYEGTAAVKWHFVGDELIEETPRYIDAVIQYTQYSVYFETVPVHIRVRGDGWIIAWINESELPHGYGDVMYWQDHSNVAPSRLMPSKAIEWMMLKLGHSYLDAEVKYYSYTHPTATEIVFFGDHAACGKYCTNPAGTFEVQKQGVTDLSLHLCWGSNRSGTTYYNLLQYRNYDVPDWTVIDDRIQHIKCWDLHRSLQDDLEIIDFEMLEGERYQIYGRHNKSYYDAGGYYLTFGILSFVE